MKDIQDALNIFSHAVAAVDPAALIRNQVCRQAGDIMINNTRLPMEHDGRIFVIGAGKASAIMAQAMEEILADRIEAGLVITKYGHALPLRKIRLVEAGHPVPDGNGVQATREMMKLVEALTPADMVFFLMSGGASALLADYPPGMDLPEMQQTFEMLLRSGAGIHEMNTVRKHLSEIKGGQLAKRIHPARLCTLTLSDVIGDDPDVIGSGPTVADESSFEDAWQVLVKYGIADKVPVSASLHIKEGLFGNIADTPKPGAACFSNTYHNIIGNNRIALEAAAVRARALGYETDIVTHRLEGEARDLGRMLAEKAMAYNGPLPACFLYGGESTVTIKGKGTGGRNQELALAAGIALGFHPDITVLSGGTDGTDGPTDAAGAVVNAEIMNKARELRYDPAGFLDNNDSYNFFSSASGLVKTGATHTNVMDIIILLINKPTLN